MEPRHLATLRELGARGSVTAVAKALHLTPAAVSQQLQQLQRVAPVALTRKEGRKLVLTSAGERLVRASEGVWDALAHADDVLRGLSDDPVETVRISALQSAALAWFPHLAADANLDVELYDRDVPVEEFVSLAGDVDIVIAHRAPHSTPWPAALTVRQLLSEPFDIALRIGHPALDGGELNLSVLGGLTWIAVHVDYPMATWIDIVANRLGQPIHVRHRVNDFSVAAAIVAASESACLLPRYLHGEEPGVVRMPIPGLCLERHIDALLRPEALRRGAVARALNRIENLAAAQATGRFM